MNKVIKLASRPTGKPTDKNFKFSEEERPEASEGEILLKTIYVSVDPYLRGRMSEGKSYIPPFEVGKPIASGIIAEVIESKHKDFEKGEYVSGMLEWKQYQVSDGKDLNKADKNLAPLSAFLGVLGMTGLTAYFGLTKIGEPEKGETLVVSGAAGAVGSTVGQIGKILGMKVVGIAGSDEKISMIKEKFGYDEGINYDTTDDMAAAINKACPDGVDVYFDNVGGEISDGVMKNINKFARIVNCGAISLYNETEMPTGPRPEVFLIKNSAKMQGFIIGDFQDRFPEGVQQLGQWLKEGKLTYEETIREGFDNIPKAFLELFEGKNKGKMLVKVAED
ncbi:NADP-dependent oxidoreductase [Robertkochia aurantiaca]|uniref:NADP-dependent oxidoreductase n=1 Tax=Robertkochia aurantiaca TaxID=2873700 RepID=UPI001CCF307B|nr:NADP-dependent oxidoreductase [Robertkochia sp. 3YJGBD-33]